MAGEGRDVYYSYKGGYYLGINKVDSAEYFFRKGLSCSSSFSNTESACRGLAALYKQLNQVDSLVKYTEMARVANDSAYACMTTEKLLHMKTLYDYGQQQRIASDEREGRQCIVGDCTYCCFVCSGSVSVLCFLL